MIRKQTIAVQLLRDSVYGSRGDVVEIPPGRMRNLLFPRKQAAYVVDGQTLPIPTETVKLEPRLQAKSISPEERLQLLQTYLPKEFVFSRKAQDDKGTIFGSVGTVDIKDRILGTSPDLKTVMDRILIQMPDGRQKLKEVGNYVVNFQSGSSSLSFNVSIVNEVP